MSQDATASGRMRLLIRVSPILLLLVSCPTPPVELLVVRDSGAVHARPDLERRLRADLYAFFRFTNREFAQRVCAAFSERRMPDVNLHGDAHLEQYAITGSGQGLADYDDAASGPAVLDLVRFGVSLRLMGTLEGWSTDHALDEFLRGYREGLSETIERVPSPSIADRIRRSLGTDRNEFLAYVDGMMEPVDDDAEGPLRAGLRAYVQSMKDQNPTLSEHFFDMRAFGRHRGGLGSSLDKKFLLRLEGQTPDADDDVVLEVKEVRDMSGVSCVHRGFGAFSIVVSQRNIGRMSPRFLAQVPEVPETPPNTRPFWVHEWISDYHELQRGDVRTEVELDEIAFDVGVQLGEGHVRGVGGPSHVRRRREQEALMDDLNEPVRQAIDELTRLVVRSWEAYARNE